MSDELPDSPESEWEAQRQTVVLLAVFVEGGMLVAASILGWMIDQEPPLASFKWTLKGLLWGIAAPAATWRFSLSRGAGRSALCNASSAFSDEVIRPLLAPCSVIDLFGISALAGLGEELFFRGVLQEAFTHWFNDWIGVTVSVLFGLMHPITFTYAVFAMLTGVYLSCVWLCADHNLLAIVITHALYDFVVLLACCAGRYAAALDAVERAGRRESRGAASVAEGVYLAHPGCGVTACSLGRVEPVFARSSKVAQQMRGQIAAVTVIRVDHFLLGDSAAAGPGRGSISIARLR